MKTPEHQSSDRSAARGGWGDPNDEPNPVTQCLCCSSRSIPKIKEATDALVRTTLQGGMEVRVLAPETPRWARMSLLSGMEVVRRYECGDCGHVRAVLSFDHADRERFRKQEKEQEIAIERVTPAYVWTR